MLLKASTVSFWHFLGVIDCEGMCYASEVSNALMISCALSQGLDQSLKNFATSVPLVADLRSPAMRDRHWQQLMTTTKVHSVPAPAAPHAIDMSYMQMICMLLAPWVRTRVRNWRNDAGTSMECYHPLLHGSHL